MYDLTVVQYSRRPVCHCKLCVASLHQLTVDDWLTHYTYTIHVFLEDRAHCAAHAIQLRTSGRSSQLKLCHRNLRPRHRVGMRRVKGVSKCILVMQSTLHFIRGQQCLTLPVIIPPFALQSKTAETLAATFEAAAAIDLQQLAATSDVLFLVRDCDSDSSNIKALNMEWGKMAPLLNVCQKRAFCTVHQFNMIAGRMLEAGSPSSHSSWLVSGYFNASHLLRNPGYFEMVLRQLPSVIGGMLRIRQGQPEPQQVSANYDTFRILGLTHEDATQMSQLFNGNLTDHTCIEHWCDSGIIDITSLARDMSTLLQTIFYNTLPDIPIPARWMRVSSTFQWWSGVMCVHGLGMHVHRAAFDPQFASCELQHRITEFVAMLEAALAASNTDEHEFDSTDAYYRGVFEIDCQSTLSLQCLSKLNS